MGKSKHGRNKVKCQNYRANGRREKNKARRLANRLAMLKRKAKKREANGVQTG